MAVVYFQNIEDSEERLGNLRSQHEETEDSLTKVKDELEPRCKKLEVRMMSGEKLPDLNFTVYHHPASNPDRCILCLVPRTTVTSLRAPNGIRCKTHLL